MKKVVVRQDEDCHWYVIPAELEEEFSKLLYDSNDEYEAFIDKFSKYMTGGSVNNVQLYAEIE